MYLSVFCTEDLIGRTPKHLLNVIAAIPRQLQGQADPEDMIEYEIFGICQNWPVTEAGPWVKKPLASDIPTLVLAGELDRSRRQSTANWMSCLEELPESIGSYESAALTWDFYRFEIEVGGVRLALAAALAEDDAGAYLVPFHKTDLDFSGGVRQGLRSSPWLSLRSPVGAGFDRPIGLCKLSPMASAPGGVATESQPLLRETALVTLIAEPDESDAL